MITQILNRAAKMKYKESGMKNSASTLQKKSLI